MAKTTTEVRSPQAARPPKPAAMPVMADAIPARLRDLRRWVCWRWTWTGKKWDKPPIQPADGRAAKSNDPATWTTFDAALAAVQAGRADGAGIVLGDLGDGTNLAGVDLDDCREPETGEIDPAALYVVATMHSYTEISPSGRGLKILLFGRPPEDRKDQEAGVEVYSGLQADGEHARYFCITGHKLIDAPADVMDRTAELADLHATTFARLPAATPGTPRMSDPELARDALAGLSTGRAVGYHDWIGVGMALHAVSADGEMLAAWDAWSATRAEKYQPGECARKWASFGRRGGLRLGSLIHWARADGWRPPWERNGKPTTPSRRDDDDDDDDTPSRHADPLAALQAAKILRAVPIASVRKLGARHGVYEIGLRDGSYIELGSAADVLTARKVQAAIADALGVAITELRRPQWRRYAELILRAAEIEDIGTDAISACREWIAQLTQTVTSREQNTVDVADVKAVAERLSAFSGGLWGMWWWWDVDGRLYLHASSFAVWVMSPAGCGARTSHADVKRSLRRLGFSAKRIQARHDAGIAKKYMWVSPPGWEPDE